MGARIASTLLAAACVVVTSASAASAAPTNHVDCQAQPSGADGSRAHPWTSLADASSIPLEPGSNLLLKSGTVCVGTLDLTGTGSKEDRALVSAYGRGDQPRIEATGEDAIRVLNVPFVTVENLELTNPGDGSTKKRGIHVMAVGETVPGVRVSGNWIHDVGGNLDKDGGGSGGIQVDSEGPGTGRFRHLRIEDNLIENVSRSGIFVVGVSGGERPRASEPWPEASSHVRINGNRIRRVAGDGIVTLGTDGAKVDYNRVRRGNLAGRGLADPQGMICNAGIWAFHANNTVIEHNVVSQMKFNGCDGSGFDVDYDQDGTTVQFNYSHDNEGGFMLLCTDTDPRRADVRFNLSVDDGFSFNSSPCSRPTGTYEGLRIYNNTILSPDPGVGILGYERDNLFGPASLTFFNNIVVATGDEGRGFTCEPNCHDNLFFRIPTAGTDAIVAPPRFTGDRPYSSATPAAGFRLKTRSAAYGAGARIPRSATEDYFGNRIRRGLAPNIGFWQGHPLKVAPGPIVNAAR